MMMTREEAIRELREDKALYETDNCHAGDGSPDGDLLEALDMAIESLSAEPKWTPVSEGSPKKNERYLCQNSYGLMQVMRWANNLEEVDDFDFCDKKYGGWYEYDSEWGYCERKEVVAWRPLPKPYKGESEA